MKVILFICMLSIFLFFYSLQEGMVNPVDSSGLTVLRELKLFREYVNAPLDDIITRHNQKISDNNIEIEQLNSRDLSVITDDSLRQTIYDKIDAINRDNIIYRNHLDTLKKEFLTGRINDKMTLGEATCEEEKYVNNTDTCSVQTDIQDGDPIPYSSASTESQPAGASAQAASVASAGSPPPSEKASSGSSPPPPAATASSTASSTSSALSKTTIDLLTRYGYGNDYKNPFMNPFIYSLNVYKVNINSTIISIVPSIKDQLIKESIFRIIQTYPTNINLSTTVKNAIIFTLNKSYSSTPDISSTKNIFILLRDDTVYAKASPSVWVTGESLESIGFKLNLIYAALTVDAQYVNAYIPTYSPTILKRVDYVGKLRSRLMKQYPDGSITASTTLASAISMNKPERF